eukprot:GHVT01001823.1.p1 GENE.GHVT01001823.1~~GHVT01001823.1.p1  ORF type:complete len:486 (-),score=157.09 GHVT01001823.1:941-2398(-)
MARLERKPVGHKSPFHQSPSRKIAHGRHSQSANAMHLHAESDTDECRVITLADWSSVSHHPSSSSSSSSFLFAPAWNRSFPVGARMAPWRAAASLSPPAAFPISTASGGALKYPSMWEAGRTIVHEEGLGGLWRGNFTNICRAALVYTTKLCANDLIKKKLKENAHTPANGHASSYRLHTQDHVPTPTTITTTTTTTPTTTPTTTAAAAAAAALAGSSSTSLSHLLIAGAGAGLIQKTGTYPMDLVTVRIALGINAGALSGGSITASSSSAPRSSSSSSSSASASSSGVWRRLECFRRAGPRAVAAGYGGIFDCVARIWQREGAMGFFKGFGPTIATGVPYVTLQMTLFDKFRTSLEGCWDAAPGTDGGWGKLVVTSGLAGSLAGVLAQTAVFPGDTVRKRMMANGVDGRRRLYSSSFDCVAKMWKREGALSFYSGLRPCVLKAVPSGALQFGIYELCKGLFRRLHSDLPPVAYAPPPPRALPPR